MGVYSEGGCPDEQKMIAIAIVAGIIAMALLIMSPQLEPTDVTAPMTRIQQQEKLAATLKYLGYGVGGWLSFLLLAGLVKGSDKAK